jgi:hypothetical protein
MLIYVAAASAELPRAKRIMALLRQAGHRITHDWTPSVERGGSVPTSFSARKEAAEDDCGAIIAADVVLFLHPSPGVFTTGFWFELGYFMGLESAERSTRGYSERACLVSFETGESRQQPAACIFTSLAASKNLHLLDEEILTGLEAMVPF